ncbi:unnamed protein product [Toxocara canis]|uniref:Secreted protein n=1 Tax=Toxocara canis TaxID=6265 RepID=A0A183TZN1_TOXCA|nr:unnamed protein product [Toxocara canis]
MMVMMVMIVVVVMMVMMVMMMMVMLMLMLMAPDGTHPVIFRGLRFQQTFHVRLKGTIRRKIGIMQNPLDVNHPTQSLNGRNSIDIRMREPKEEVILAL